MVHKILLGLVLLFMHPHAEARHKEVETLASAVYMEAQGASKRDKFLVARTIVNRTAHKEFPKTIHNVINQTKPSRQFEFTKRKRVHIDKHSKEYQESLRAARRALSIPANPNSILFFHDKTYGRGFPWARPMINTRSFIFYGAK